MRSALRCGQPGLCDEAIAFEVLALVPLYAMAEARQVLLHALHYPRTMVEEEAILLDPMSGFEFEEFFAHLLTKLGYGQV